MANDSEKYIRGAIVQGGDMTGGYRLNTPSQYGDRKHQYLAKRTAQFIQERARYASDFVQAEVQGIDLEDFYRYITTNIRLADISSQSASTTAKNVDDAKVILFESPNIDYFPIGAKVQTMGSTWICTNPSNLSGVHSTAIIQRCNAAYSLYDHYGNIITEPIVVEKPTMASNDNSTPQNLVMMEGYFSVICQLNENTRQLDQNQRIILGSKAYHITGFTDFIQEFTGDYDSVHVLRFTIRIEEPTDNDDLINHIANGNNYMFSAGITGSTRVSTNEQISLAVHFMLNEEEIAATAEYPLTWQWTSNAPEIASVDENGTVTGVSAGNARITARLVQNPVIQATYGLIVEATEKQPYVAFAGVVPQTLSQFDELEISAAYFENGEMTSNVVAWKFTGADKGSYRASIYGNKVTIFSQRADDVPLTITAEYNGYSTSASVKLISY